MAASAIASASRSPKELGPGLSGWASFRWSATTLEGGIVSDILVHEGEIVEQNQPLLRLDATPVHAELNRLRAREASLRLREARLRALVDGLAPDFAGTGITVSYPALYADQLAFYRMQTENAAASRAAVKSQIAAHRSQLAALEGQREALRENVWVVQEQAAMRGELHQRGVTPRAGLLGSQREVAQARDRLAEVDAEIAHVRAQIADTESRFVDFEARRRRRST